MGRRKDPSIFDMIDDLQKSALRRERERIREENVRIKESNRLSTIENENKVQLWNDEINEKINLIDNYYKNITLEVFNSSDYYNSLKEKLVINNYTPLEEPNSKLLRKKIGCFKENKTLEKIFKNRINIRNEREAKFQEEWSLVYQDYLKKEEENRKEYEEYKRKLILRNEEFNKNIDNRYELFESGNVEEIKNIVKYYLYNSVNLNEKNSIGVDRISVDISDNAKDWTINLKFAKPEIYLMRVKSYKYLKSKWEIKENEFSDYEREKMFKKIVFNSCIYYLFKIKTYFKQFVTNVIINSYVEDYNGATGQLEEKCIFSCLIDLNENEFGNLNNIDSFEFFEYLNARYKKPLLNLKSIIPYSFSKTFADYIENETDGFDFENMSKVLLEKNGFVDVTVTKKSGDFGADVIATKDKITYAIQCKKYSSKVGVDAVQEVMASRQIYKCHVGAILTNNDFTPSAIKLAEANNIVLWNGDELEKMIANMPVDKEKSGKEEPVA